MFDCCNVVEDPSFHDEQAPHLGVSVFSIRNILLEDIKAAGKDESSTIYDIESVIRKKGALHVCPRDNKIGAAYVDCLDGNEYIGPANRMLSYAYSYTIGDIIESLETYCKQNQLDAKQTYVWICCLCVNQHRGASKDDFEILQQIIDDAIIGVGHVLAMVTPWDEPLCLSRAWCLFEMSIADTTDIIEIDIIMPPREKERMIENLQNYDNLLEALDVVDIEKALASKEIDKRNIMKLVNENSSPTAVNGSVKKLLQDKFEKMALKAVDDYNTSGNISSDLSYARLCASVGKVMERNGNYTSAIELYHKCLEVELKVLGEEHTETADTYGHIGMAMHNHGDLDSALEMYGKCLAVEEKVLGEEHAGTASTYWNIGRVMEDKEDNEAALRMFQKCLTTEERVYGEQHDTPLATKKYMARLQVK